MAYLILCFWLLGYFFLWHIPRLKRSPHPNFDDTGVSIIIPARNEEGILELLLESLTLQTIELMEIIVVDDQSEDATAEIAEKFGHKVIRSRTPPEGWLGKSWACWQGAQTANYDILLFLDSDVVLAPGALAKLLAHFTEREGLLTVQPYHSMKKNYERLSAIFNIVAMAGVNAFTPLRSALKPAGAFGPCIMCRKKVYFEIGGHKITRKTVLESLPLGNAFIRAGYPVRCFGGKGAISFRMYPQGFRSLVEGFTKGFATGAKAISISTLIILVCWIFGGVSLTRHLVQALISGSLDEILIWLVLDCLYVGQIQWMLHRIGNFGVRTSIFFQIPLLFFVVIFFLSSIKSFVIGKSLWKGRVVQVDPKRGRTSCD